MLATFGVITLLAIAAVLGLAAALDGVYDGRTLAAVILIVMAVAIWRRVNRGVHR